MSTIPTFPKFANLSIKLKNEFEDLVGDSEPYSEFSFPCIYSWDSDNKAKVSKINDNLVIQMPDYLNDTPFISILGKSKLDSSVDVLLDKVQELRFVPESVVVSLNNPSKYRITPDRDQFDYVFSVEQLINLPGRHFKGRRNKSSLFLRVHSSDLEIRKTNFQDMNHIVEIQKTFNEWADERNKSAEEVEHELKALKKILEESSHFNLIGIQVFIKGRCVGFSINEVVHKDYAMSRFQKTLKEFDHLDIFLSSLVAGEIKHFGCQYISWEQDLGIEGLRQYKSSYQPIKYLKKYTIERI